MTSTFIPSQNDIAATLAQDRPTIEAAVKSFLSLYAARGLTQQDASAQQDALSQARMLLKAVNQYTFPLLAEPTDEYKVTARAWNGLIASKQKPSKLLGRLALKLAWQHGLPSEVPTTTTSDSLFLQEFGSLLMEYDPEKTPTDDSDACLVWDTDQGATELSRRRCRRALRAKEAKEQSERLSIEELLEEEKSAASEVDEGASTLEEIPDDSKKDSTATAEGGS